MASPHVLVRIKMHGLGLLFICLLISSLSVVTQAAKPNPLPLEAFYRDPVLSGIVLSPNGNHLLALKNIQGKTLVMVINLKTGEVLYPASTDNKEFKFNWVVWANNERILMSMRFSKEVRVRGGYITVPESRLLAMDAFKPSKMVSLFKPNAKLARSGYISQFQDNVISILPDDPQHILVSVDRNFPGHQSVFKVDVYTGQMLRVLAYRKDISSWLADNQGVVRLGTGYDDKTRKVTIRVLDPSSNEWVDAWSYINLSEPDIQPLGFGDNPSELYMLFNKDGRKALFKVDLSKPGYPRQLVLEDQNYDITGRLVYVRGLKRIVGVYANHTVFFDSDFLALQKGLDKALPGSRNRIVNLSEDGQKYILRSSNQTNPGTLYYGDRTTGTLSRLTDDLPELTKDVLVGKELHRYKARDGLELDGFLSLPKSFTGKPLPTIILPHGGPMAEDTKGFDPFSAFMANRGYVVFQPNFRGSSGRGFDFMAQAIGGMGLEMQDDLEDAVQYLVEQKIADPQNVGIVGASYGGYAALMGATKTPDLFKCAISFAGLSDLVSMRDTFSHYRGKNSYRKQLGSSESQLKNTSPVRMVSKIKIPILLIHGDKDTIVPIAQSRDMAKALKDAHKTYEYIELKDGTHHLDYLPHRRQTFEAMDAFLKKYLPVN